MEGLNLHRWYAS